LADHRGRRPLPGKPGAIDLSLSGREGVASGGDMTHSVDEAAAAVDAFPARGLGSGSPVADSPAWAPLRQPAFRWLWLGVLISSVGTWMQTVGAQWLLVDAPNAAALVPLVTVANSLPVMLLALPGGVLADSFDRRWLLFTVQAYFFIVGILVAVLTAVGQMSPALLLAFTFALGAGGRPAGHDAVVRRIMLRAILFAASAMSLCGLLPLLAS